MSGAARWIVPLAECTQPELCGGKARGLGELARRGYATPPGQVLLEPLRAAHLARAGVAAAAAELQRLLPLAPAAELLARAAALRAAIINTALDPALSAALAGLYSRLWQGKTLAVRSSAHGEDSAGHSFAGQLDSFLGVDSPAALELAIRRTWASLWSERCVRYQQQRAAPLAHMGVIVQEQVDARYSGVLFTAAPAAASGEPAMLAEYCAGLGDALVAGALTPGQILFDRHDGRVLHHVAAPDAGAEARILAHPAALAQLARAALALERALGAPLDIEWSIARDGTPFLLQARPITAAAREVSWTNANIAENFPEPVTPFLYSFIGKGYAAYFRNLGLGFGIARKRIAAMQDALDHVIGAHGGRLYYNLSNIHALLYLAPGGRWLTRFFNEFTGANAFPAPRHAPARLGALARAAELARIPFMVAWQYLLIERRLGAFERRVDAFCDATRRADLAGRSLAALRDDLRGFLDIRLNHWNGAALADTAAMVCYGLLKLVLARAAPDTAGAHNDLLKGLADVASGEPVLRLWELSRRVRAEPALARLFAAEEPEAIRRRLDEPAFAGFRAAFLDYLERWGFRSSGELMLTVPSPAEDPRPTLALLKAYAALDGPSPQERLREQGAARAQLTARVLAAVAPRAWQRLPLAGRGWWLGRLLRATHGAIRLRERARFRQARLYVHLRHLVLAVGERLQRDGRLDAPEDLFHLGFEELDELLCGHALYPDGVRARVAQRRAEQRAFADWTPPDQFVLPFGRYLSPPSGAAPDGPAAALPLRRLQGASACGGCVTAAATVLASAAEGHRLRAGDILVTRQTDPGWASVFFLVRGLVVERGGMLSHGAIIAREYGIPAVVGVAGATRAIRSGDRLNLDGDRGVVDILS